MQKYAKPALFRRSQVLVTLCSFCGPTVYVLLEERGGRAGMAGFRPPPALPGASARPRAHVHHAKEPKQEAIKQGKVQRANQ